MVKSLFVGTWILSLFVTSVADAQSYGGSRESRPLSRTFGFYGPLIDFGLYYSQTEATATPATGNTWQNTTSVYDVKLGYITEDSLYLGLIYSIRNDNQTSVARVDGQSAGAGLGYFVGNGFNMRAFYKFQDNYGDYTNGTGYHAEVGYAVNPTSRFFLGLALTLRETTYKANNTIVGFQSWVRKETYPAITLGFILN